MTIYEKAKSLVTAREAAEHYGLTVNRYGMALCPFHDDQNPSMKLDDRFHCFGCGEDGDVIDFTAKFFNLSLPEAAEKLIDTVNSFRTHLRRPSRPTRPNAAMMCCWIWRSGCTGRNGRPHRRAWTIPSQRNTHRTARCTILS